MSKPPQARGGEPPSEPIDVVDGIPDRARGAALWKVLLLATMGLVWLAVLVYCWLAGGVRP